MRTLTKKQILWYLSQRDRYNYIQLRGYKLVEINIILISREVEYDVFEQTLGKVPSRYIKWTINKLKR